MTQKKQKCNFQQHGERKDGLFRSLCKGCGVTEHKKSFKKVFLQVGWFRGDDEYLGIFCADCIKLNKYISFDKP